MKYVSELLRIKKKGKLLQYRNNKFQVLKEEVGKMRQNVLHQAVPFQEIIRGSAKSNAKI